MKIKKIVEDLLKMINRKDVDILEVGFEDDTQSVPSENGYMEHFKTGKRTITIVIYSKRIIANT